MKKIEEKSFAKKENKFEKRDNNSEKWENKDRKQILTEKIKMQEYIYGKHIVMSALKNKNSIKELFILEDNEDLKKIAKQKNIKHSVVDKSFFDKRFNDKVHQGYCAKLNPYDYWDLKQMIISAKKTKENPIFVILDKVTDPHNFGSIIRNVVAFDIDGIIIGKHNQSLINSTVHKTSAGATFSTKICLINNINNSISTLKENGFWIVGTSLESTTQITELDKNTSYAFILGSEGKGISTLTSKHCDMNVIIPISNKIDSLNVSVASGILMYEIKK